MSLQGSTGLLWVYNKCATVISESAKRAHPFPGKYPTRIYWFVATRDGFSGTVEIYSYVGKPNAFSFSDYFKRLKDSRLYDYGFFEFDRESTIGTWNTRLRTFNPILWKRYHPTVGASGEPFYAFGLKTAQGNPRSNKIRVAVVPMGTSRTKCRVYDAGTMADYFTSREITWL